MSDSKEVLIEFTHNNQVAKLILNRPKRGNSLNASLNSQLLQHLVNLQSDPKVRVIVITGNGKFFCTGMDLQSAGSGNSNSTSVPDTFIKLMEQIKNSSKPVICRVNGPVMGGGVGIVFASDVRIVSSEAYFSFPEVKRGFLPAMISAYIVPQLGPFKSKQYMLTGQRITAQELNEDRVISAIARNEEELDKLVDQYVDDLISSAPNAMVLIKQAVDRLIDHDHRSNTEYVKTMFSTSIQSDEASYGIGSFLQKQKPDWTQFQINKSKL